MTIAPTSLAGATASLAGGQSINKDAFLNLLVLQLRNQDPLNPLSNEQMLAQLAQFSSLEQMQQINSSMASQVVVTQSVNNAIATTLIGKEVKASGDTLVLGGAGGTSAEVLLNGKGTAHIRVYDEHGELVRSMDRTGVGPGWLDIDWDGRDNAGNAMEPGNYRLEVTQTLADGTDVPVPTFVTGLIDGIRFEDGATYLIVDGRQVTLSDILEINAVNGNR